MNLVFLLQILVLTGVAAAEYSRRIQLHPNMAAPAPATLLFWKHGPLFLMNLCYLTWLNIIG